MLLQANVPDQPLTQDVAAAQRISFAVGHKVKVVSVSSDGCFGLQSVADGSDFNLRIKNAILGVVTSEPVEGKLVLALWLRLKDWVILVVLACD